MKALRIIGFLLLGLVAGFDHRFQCLVSIFLGLLQTRILGLFCQLVGRLLGLRFRVFDFAFGFDQFLISFFLLLFGFLDRLFALCQILFRIGY